MICELCHKTIEPNTLIVCRACWDVIPKKDRVQLAQMHGRKQCTKSKIASLKRKLKEKSIWK